MFAPTVAPMQRFRVRYGWVAAGVLALVGDVLSTWVALGMGMSEGNPSADWVFTTFGFWPGSALLALPWSVLVASASLEAGEQVPHRVVWRSANLAGRVAIAVRFLVVVSNVRLIVGAL